MIRDNLFEIPMWSLPCLNFKKKKEQLVKLLKLYPEKRVGLQNFATNRQSNRPNLKEAFSNIIEEELTMLVNQITDIHLPISKEKNRRNGDIRIFITDIKKIKNILGWEPTLNRRTIINDTFRWIIDNKKVLESILK